MCNLCNLYFFFSFGGRADVGEIHEVCEKEKIDFPTEQETGYGFCLRSGIEVSSFSGATALEMKVFVETEIEAALEYVSSKPVPVKHVLLEPGENIVHFPLDVENEYKEVKLFVPKARNLSLPKTSFLVKEIILK